MTTPEPTFRLRVDLMNPGQFFACCGLLELASRLGQNTLSWFDPQDAFNLSGAFGDLLDRFRRAQFKQIELDPPTLQLRNVSLPKRPDTVNPIEIALAGAAPLTLDWWLRPSQHNRLKLWSGSNSVRAMVEDAFAAIREDNSVDILNAVIQLPRQPFFYAAARPLHERDFGISLDKIGRRVEFEHLPYVELLTLIALQRFRPEPTEDDRFGYSTWTLPLPAEIAAAVVAGALPALAHESFEFPVIARDDKGHKQFTSCERRGHV